jgi:hypothetical protein
VLAMKSMEVKGCGWWRVVIVEGQGVGCGVGTGSLKDEGQHHIMIATHRIWVFALPTGLGLGFGLVETVDVDAVGGGSTICTSSSPSESRIWGAFRLLTRRAPDGTTPGACGVLVTPVSGDARTRPGSMNEARDWTEDAGEVPREFG